MVALPAGKVEAFVRKPDTGIIAVLLYGPDRGLVRERADKLARMVVDDLSDPFRVVELTVSDLLSDTARLSDEMAALSMIGGRRVIRVRSATNDLTNVFTSALQSPVANALTIAEAGELRKGAKLRSLFEGAETAAALPCYSDSPREIGDVVRESLAAFGLEAERDALEYLSTHLGNDRMVTRREIEKLAAYMGEERVVRRAEAVACVGDSTSLSLDDLAFAVGSGNHAAMARTLDRLEREGTAAVSILRAVQQHFVRLHQAAGAIQGGASTDQALARLRPQPHFSRKDMMRRQVEGWPPGRLATALHLLLDAELDCKSTGMPDRTICGRVLLQITEAGRRSRV
ncbi:MAG: DNA polymerase III subunit delta [Rhodospirillaceae bacterium]|nr:DNA polymerase III subunit delta [Rhodospirillaceae bacterium]